MEKNYLKGIEHFNRGEFFECHEVLEALWMAEPGPDKLFYQGLIQVAVAFYHLLNDNYRGAAVLLREGAGKLRHYLPVHKGIDLEKFLAALEPWQWNIQAALSGKQLEATEAKLPKIELQPQGD